MKCGPVNASKAHEYAKESVAEFCAVEGARAGRRRRCFWPSRGVKAGRLAYRVQRHKSTKILGPSFDLHVGGED